ncbi:transcription factor E2F8 [Meleagris gallopavo]|uniref:transcription factor E2F8 n=1 Tax=Meleagris gallopavo TaxID=9103 RepID=UPI00093D4CD5|nr:transcription factor E2F8 [Meleagris gallopavo]
MAKSPKQPWTPTANLKVLISAASPEIRSRERSRGLQGARCCQEHLSGDEYEKSQPSRKEKSLGLLCLKFLARYPDYPSTVENIYICLDEVAEELNVERRRIYSIVNVFESLHMVSRLAKNRYIWHGRHNLAKTLQTLKKVGEENKYTEKIQMIKKREYEHEFDLDGKGNEEVARSFVSIEHSEMCFVELPGIEFCAASVNSRKDKSLRVMSQKFVMLLLVSTPQIVSLEVAAKILIGEDQLEDLDKNKFKTKIRRLYDIANVLSSIELIKKVHITEERGRKPAFKWTGPEVPPNTHATKLETTSAPCISHISESTTSKEQCSKNLFPSRVKQNFTRHPSLIKLVKSIESDRRKIQSAPTSPVKTSTTGTDENVSAYKSEVSQLAAIPQYQLAESPKRPKDMKNNLSGSLWEDSLPWPEAAPKASTHTAATPPKPLVTQPLSALPPSHQSASAVIQPQPHSGASYAIYLHPSHAVTAYSPSFMLQALPCANVTGIKSINPKALSEMTSKEGDNCTAATDPGKAMAAKERPVMESESSSKSCLKRSQALQENNLIKKCRSDEECCDNAVGEPPKHERPPSIGSQSNHEVDNFQEEKQNKFETLDQSVASCSEQYKRECAPEDEDRTKTKQDIPVAFANPAHEAFFPSGYLIPLTQCTHHSNKAGLPNREKAGLCSLQHTATHSSPAAGAIPVMTSELKAVNIPAFHITSLNIMLSPTSIAAAPVLSNSHLNSSNASSVPNPSSSLLNFTLQHVGLIPAGVQVPASPVLQHIPIPSKPESINHSSENMTLQEEKPTVLKEPPEAQTMTENFFHTPGGPNTVPLLSANSGGTDTVSQGTSYIPQRKLEVSEN